MFLLLIAPLGALGLTLVLLGLIGRRVGDEPRCPHCRHDLSGLTGPTTCPECGTSLAGGIARGLRRRRRGMLTIGSALTLVVILAAVGTIGRMRALRWLPSAWLVYVHEPLATGPHRAEILGELSARAANGLAPELAPELATALADRILARQAEAIEAAASGASSLPWEPAAGNFLASAFMAGLVDPDRVDRFLVNAVDCTLGFDPTIEPGELRPRVRVTVARGLGGSVAGFDDSLDVHFDEVVVNDATHHHGGTLVMSASGAGGATFGPTSLEVPPTATERAVRIRVEVRRGAHTRQLDLAATARLDPNRPTVDRAAVAAAFRDAVEIVAVEATSTTLVVEATLRGSRHDFAEPPLLLVGGERRRCGTWGVTRSSASRAGRWHFEWTITPEELATLAGGISLRFDSLEINAPGLDEVPEFRGRMSIPPTDLDWRGTPTRRDAGR